jgi:diacylglycerol kinase family enzyme
MPIAFIPNGSGNDTLRSISVFDLDKALDYIVKGDLIKIDLTKMIVDHETE